MDVEKVIEQFEDDVYAIVMRAFPGMIAEQLALLQSPVVLPSTGSIDHQVLMLRKQGMTQTAIGVALGTSQTVIFSILKRNGLTKSRKPKAPPKIGPLQAAWQEHGNKVAAAKALGLSESTYRDRLAKEMQG